jgi:hypothetical protein
MASSYAVGNARALLGGAHEPALKKNAPAVTVPQGGMVWSAVVPFREVDTPLALDIRADHQQRNPAASLSHRKRRIALVIQRE